MEQMRFNQQVSHIHFMPFTEDQPLVLGDLQIAFAYWPWPRYRTEGGFDPGSVIIASLLFKYDITSRKCQVI